MSEADEHIPQVVRNGGAGGQKRTCWQKVDWSASVAGVLAPLFWIVLYPVLMLVRVIDSRTMERTYFAPIAVLSLAVGLSLFVARRWWRSGCYLARWRRRLTRGLALLMVAASLMGVQYFNIVRARTINSHISAHMGQLAAGLDQYCLEHNVREAKFSDLVGPDKFVKPFKPAGPEVYPSRYVLGQPIVVTNVDGFRTLRRDPY